MKSTYIYYPFFYLFIYFFNLFIFIYLSSVSYLLFIKLLFFVFLSIYLSIYLYGVVIPVFRAHLQYLIFGFRMIVQISVNQSYQRVQGFTPINVSNVYTVGPIKLWNKKTTLKSSMCMFTVNFTLFVYFHSNTFAINLLSTSDKIV